MKNTKAKGSGIVFACLLSVSFIFFATQAMGQDEKIVPEKKLPETRVIRFDSPTAPYIDTVKVPAGTTVIWVNGMAGFTLEIQFDSKKVTLACSSPIHFITDEDGSFISNKIPFGGVASLCFIEKGEFTYIAKKTPHRLPPVPAVKGKIIVE
ncbi:MAG: hypothetical protein JW832_08220 [Deltaproteobacteria bacterium]|jgi:hypothetical protein|nr:hypothetical protein [Deltaproteobacteria bacterium]